MADYTPHSLVGLLAAGVAYVFRTHVKTDEDRYHELSKSITELTTQQSVNHAEILTILLKAAQDRENIQRLLPSKD